MEVQDVVVLIDRRAEGQNELAERGYRLHAVLTLAELLDFYENAGKVPAEKIAEVKAFLNVKSET